jgi:hypothetical protein
MHGAGVEVHVEVWEGLLHGWYLFANEVADAAATYLRVGDPVRQLSPQERKTSGTPRRSKE